MCPARPTGSVAPLTSSRVPGSRPTSLHQHGGPVCKITRPETVEKICVSWNRYRCPFATCSFHHLCATCKQKGHRAKDCQETPVDSQYNSALSPAPKPSCAQEGGNNHNSSLPSLQLVAGSKRGLLPGPSPLGWSTLDWGCCQWDC